MSQDSVTDYDSEMDALDSDENVCTMINIIDDGIGEDEVSCGDADTRCLRLLIAVEKLHVIASREEMYLDEGPAEELHDCINDIIQFTKAVSSGLFIGNKNHDCMKCVASIFDLSLLSDLVRLRQQLLSSAAENIDFEHSGQAVVCWIDFFFAYFTDMISFVAGKQDKVKMSIAPFPASLQRQRHEENLRVACQLPREIHSFPNVLRSRYASPAAKRLALTILFAAFVVRPDIEDCDPWSESDIDPRHILECAQTLLDEFVEQARSIAMSEDNPMSCGFRSAYSMLVALHASAEFAIQRKEDCCLSPFRPHALGSLLELIQIVLIPYDSIDDFVIKELDEAQFILLHWGCTVPWAWTEWDDPRVHQYDIIVKLTANWLFRLDESLVSPSWEDQQPNANEDVQSFTVSSDLALALSSATSFKPGATLIALFHQFIYANNSLEAASALADDTSNNMLHIYRATWCLANLVSDNENSLPSESVALVAEQAVILFGALDATVCDTLVKKEIIRLLNALNNDTLEKTFTAVQKNIKLVTKIAGVTGKVSRILSEDNSEEYLLLPENSLDLVTLLDLIALLCKSGNGVLKCLPVTTSALLSNLIGFLSLRSGYLDLKITLLNCITCAYPRCRSSNSPAKANADVKLDKTWEDEDAYNLALEMSGVNLSLASAFASYLALTVDKKTDALLVAEAWDYLRDVILVVGTGRLEFEEVDRDTSCVTLACATENIFRGLAALLERSNAVIAHYLLKSPMTLSLVDVLRKPSLPPSLVPFSSVDSEREEQASQFAKLCEGFLEKLRKIESDPNKAEKDD
ncbi:hypothetical protein DFH11DRAFT_1558304 [Phellopilus nigrolimitatus]|nr:hypothetical protein DFH11DRAFT_1558304 [Phellopilus nigrolimitatus]